MGFSWGCVLRGWGVGWHHWRFGRWEVASVLYGVLLFGFFFFLYCFVTATEHGPVVHKCVRRALPTAPGAFLICFWYVCASVGVVVFSSTAPAPNLVHCHIPRWPAASPNPTAGCRVRGDRRAGGAASASVVDCHCGGNQSD